MNRYACPRCGKSLRFRLLPHVPINPGKGRIAFSCIHCGAVLTYTEPTSRLYRVMWSTPWRSLITYLVVVGGSVAIGLATGMEEFRYAVLALGALLLVLAHSFPRRPAYELVAPGPDAEAHGDSG